MAVDLCSLPNVEEISKLVLLLDEPWNALFLEVSFLRSSPRFKAAFWDREEAEWGSEVLKNHPTHPLRKQGWAAVSLPALPGACVACPAQGLQVVNLFLTGRALIWVCLVVVVLGFYFIFFKGKFVPTRVAVMNVFFPYWEISLSSFGWFDVLCWSRDIIT